MLALIDADLLAYECGGLKGEDGEFLPFEMCWSNCQSKIEGMISATSATDYMVYLSSPTIKTWRYDRASILPYKGKRAGSEKPKHWESIRYNLPIHYKCTIAEFMEADDAISIQQYSDITYAYAMGSGQDDCNTVICSRDKDLDMVPGWHYGWPTTTCKERPLWFQSELGGLRCFYKQLLTGDTTDSVLGLYNVGDKAACVQRLKNCDDERSMFDNVWVEYEKRFGNYAKDFMLENGQLLWMQRTSDDRWNPWEDGRIDKWIEENNNNDLSDHIPSNLC